MAEGIILEGCADIVGDGQAPSLFSRVWRLVQEAGSRCFGVSTNYGVWTSCVLCSNSLLYRCMFMVIWTMDTTAFLIFCKERSFERYSGISSIVEEMVCRYLVRCSKRLETPLEACLACTHKLADRLVFP